jgi:tRNA (guanine-N7-)-methyltransferase
MENSNEIIQPDRSIRTYMLRSGRMTDLQKKALEELSPRYCLPVEPHKSLDLKIAFGNDNPVVAEIGFGMGRATWQIAKANPSTNYLAFEVHSPGVGKLLSDIEAHNISNIKIVHHDAVEVFEDNLPPAIFSGLHVFYPDPWPKKRHHKRRLIRPGLVDILISRLAPGAYFYFVTDIEEYAEWTIDILSRVKGIHNRYEKLAPHQEWRPETKFEARAAHDGRTAFEIIFERE